MLVNICGLEEIPKSASVQDDGYTGFLRHREVQGLMRQRVACTHEAGTQGPASGWS